MGQLLYPPEIVDIEGEVIFLAGPIQGAVNWQEEAVKIIQAASSAINIASPRRPIKIYQKFSVEEYAAQVDWETHYLRKAACGGIIMFWLAKEYEHLCRRAYAQTSRFELGEWKIRHERDGVKLVIGIEDGFSNASYIRKRFKQDCPEIQVQATLEETCKEALRFL